MSASTSVGYEVVVVGAGPAGSCIARLLALRGKNVLLVDPLAPHHGRSEVIPPTALRLLDAVGIVHLMDDSAVSRRCLGIERLRGGSVRFKDDFFRYQAGAGYVVDRARLDNKLRKFAIDAGVEFKRGRLRAVKFQGGLFQSSIRTEPSVITACSGIMVDATGRSASVGRRLGADRILSETMLATRREGPDESCSETNGPVWLQIQGSAGRWSYRIAGPDGRRQTWEISRGKIAKGISGAMDASSARLSRASGERWVAVGDAAASFDPITSQGLANAFSTALIAAGAILSPRGLNTEAAALYSDAVSLTFANSERGRAEVYAEWARDTEAGL
jgi:flavin-dependent dehydrogenase